MTTNMDELNRKREGQTLNRKQSNPQTMDRILHGAKKRDASILTRKPTNWCGSAKRDVAHPTVTVLLYVILAITCSEDVHAWPS